MAGDVAPDLWKLRPDPSDETPMLRSTARPASITTELALLLGLATLWGASYTFIKIGVATIPPVTLMAARTLLAGALLLALARAAGVAMPRDRATWSRLAVQACLNSVVPFTLIAWAMRGVDAGLAAILNSTTPIFAFLITFALTRQEPATARKLVGVAAGLAGICLVIGAEALSGLGREVLPQLAIVAATVAYAGAAIYGRGFQGLNPIVPAAGSLLCAAALLVPLAAFERPWTVMPSLASLLALAALAVFSTALAFVVYFRLVRTLGAIGTTAQAYLRVPIGVGIGMLVLGETPSPSAWAGLALVVGGVMAMTVPARAPRTG